MKKIFFLFIVFFVGLVAKAEERQILTSDSVKLYVNIKGSGTPCLYIHGGPGSGSFWLEKFFGDYLEQHFRMIYVDQRGVGRSSTPHNRDYSIVRIIKDFEEVRSALGIKQWITLGHSFGGVLQMGYMELFPAAIEGMIMVNCTLSMERSFCDSWLPKAAEFAGVNYIPPSSNIPDTILSKLMTVSASMQAKGVRWKMAYSSPENEKLMNSTYNEVANWNNNFSSVALTVKDFWKDYRRETSAIKIPVLFFYGKADWSIGPDHYKDIKFPNMILWGSNVGHMPFLENRADLEKAIDSYIIKYRF